MNKNTAPVIWLTGISGAGKTTLSRKLKKHLSDRCPTELLDGDEVRDFFGGDLGYSRSERIFNVKRIAFASKLLADNGITTIVANIAPYYEVRDFIRAKISNYVQIYVQVSFNEAARRDVKGYYKKFQSQEMSQLIGADDGYDVPRAPNIIIETEKETEEESLVRILRHLNSQRIGAQ